MKGCVIMKKVYCFNCNKNVEPNVISSKNKYKINGETFFLNENIYKCPICDNEVLPDDEGPAIIIPFTSFRLAMSDAISAIFFS